MKRKRNPDLSLSINESNIDIDENVNESNIDIDENVNESNTEIDEDVNENNIDIDEDVNESNIDIDEDVNESNIDIDEDVNESNIDIDENVNESNTEIDENVNESNTDIDENVNESNIDIDPKLDLVFKRLFGIDKNKNLMIDLLNNILNREGKEKIKDVTYLNTENIPPTVIKDLTRKKNDKSNKNNSKDEKKKEEGFGKHGIMDILVKTENENINNKEEEDNNKKEEDNNKKKEKDNPSIIMIKKISEMYNIVIENERVNMENIINKRINELDSSDKEIKQMESFKNNLNESFEKINKSINKKCDNEIKIMYERIEQDNKDFVKMEATTEANELINIEIQVKNKGNMFKRSLYYASNIISQSLVKGQPYNKLPKLIMINLLNYNIFKKEKEKPHWIFTLKEKETNEEKGFYGLINFHFIELPKYDKIYDNTTMEKQYPWILFLNKPNDECFTKKPEKIFIEARKVLLTLQRDKKFKILYDQRLKEWTDYISEMEERERKGERKGIVKGERKGIVKGERIGIVKGERRKDIYFMLYMIKNGVNERPPRINEKDFDLIKDFMANSDSSIDALAINLNFDKIY